MQDSPDIYEVHPAVLKMHRDDVDVANIRKSLGEATIFADRVELPLPQNVTWPELRANLHLLSMFILRPMYLVLKLRSNSGDIMPMLITLVPRGWPIETRTGKAA